MLYLIVQDSGRNSKSIQITSDKNRAEDLADGGQDDFIIEVTSLTPLDSDVWDHMMSNYVNSILPVESTDG